MFTSESSVAWKKVLILMSSGESKSVQINYSASVFNLIDVISDCQPIDSVTRQGQAQSRSALGRQ